LAAKNYKVTLYEKNNYVGGKLAEFSEKGYRFDMGPSLFTMPEYFEDLFQAANRNLKDYLTYKKLDKSCTYFFADGKSFTFYADKNRFLKEAREQLSLDGQPVLDYLKASKKMYEGAGKLFIENSLHKTGTYFSRQALKSLSTLLNPINLQSLDFRNRQKLKAAKWIQLFNRYATYNGSSPYKTPAMMAIIPHLEHNIGTFFPEQGMYGLIKAMEDLAIELKVDIQKGQEVSQLLYSDHRISAVKVNNKTITADVFISNMDIALVYKKLLRDSVKYEEEQVKERSSSGLVFYWGIKKTFPELALHNIIFSENYKKEFTSIFEYLELPADPTIYINISSKEAPQDAPDNCENWFVMINTPAGVDISKSQIKEVRNTIVKTINKHLNTEITQLIEVERQLTPQDINKRTLSMAGALYGTASNSALSSFKRHSNFSNQYNNLFFVGGTVHPGGGIPLCLNSAKIVASQL
ncbi:MAG: 1-hydroxycarotenoid 3,4-desaturase CrtD, partial [Putridiphycobacter sp.]|nr:1-hydroxycarotenoid 3,4-desaturase CrtD [Putridiphycobacter sp.]